MVGRAELDGLTFTALNSEEASDLEVPFREDEILLALREMNGNKALGLDRLTIAFC